MTDDVPPERLTDGGRTTPIGDVANDGTQIDRRSMLGLLGAGVAGAIAGCTGGGGGDGEDTADGDADATDGGTDADDDDGTDAGNDGGTGSDGSDGDGDADGGADGGTGADGTDGDSDGDDSDGDATGPTHELPFEDDLDELAAVHGSADLDRLWLDVENTAQFARRDGADDETDGSRVNRADADSASIVYHFDSPIEGLRAETHFHNEEGGEVAVAVSTDGEEWAELDVERTLYSQAHNDEEMPGHWWANYECSAEGIGEEVTAVRFTLDGDVRWSPQLGWVEVW